LNLDEVLIDQGIEVATKLGACYVAVKLSDLKTIEYSVQNDRTQLNTEYTPGCHLRVICNGAWGFAGSSDVDASTIRRLSHQAVKSAKANATIRESPVKLAPNKVIQTKYETPIQKDPFKVSPEEIFDLLKSSVKIAREQSNIIKSSTASVIASAENRILGTSEGALISQKLIRTSAGITATAENMGIIQSSGLGQNFATKGYEWVESKKLTEAAVTEGKTAAELAKAERCPDLVTTLIIEDHMLALQIHETLGHPSELDRVLNTEVDFVGPIGESFFSPKAIGKMWYGSKIVNIVADATIEGGQGTIGYDDEAVPAKRTNLVKDGIFVGFQSSRETAAEIDLPESSGQFLSTYGYDQPVVRMTNINLLPGDYMRQELIEDTKDGILMSDYRTEIFDQRRTTFGFGAQKAWLIKNGELTKILRDPTYYGETNPFWRTCDGISKDNWFSYGGGCGKCRPNQSGRVGHFCSSARFRNVHVGGGGINE